MLFWLIFRYWRLKSPTKAVRSCGDSASLPVPEEMLLATSQFVTSKVWYFVTNNGCLNAVLGHGSTTFHIAISQFFSIYSFPLLQLLSLCPSFITDAGLASEPHRRSISARLREPSIKSLILIPLPLPFPGCHGWHLFFLQNKLLYHISRKIF